MKELINLNLATNYKTLILKNLTFFIGLKEDRECSLTKDEKVCIAKFGAALMSKEFKFTSDESVKPFLKLR